MEEAFRESEDPLPLRDFSERTPRRGDGSARTSREHPLRIGIYTSAGPNAPLDALLERFRRIEDAGFHTAWLGQMFEFEALTALALAGRVTRRVELGSWVVPTWPRHPGALAQQALTAQAACRGRLVLGIGVSHETVIAKRLGLDYQRPVRHAREYMKVLQPLLAGERAQRSGDGPVISLQLEVEDAPPPVVFLAALGPLMLQLAGRAAEGVAIWPGGPRYLGAFAIPRVLAAARKAGRPTPRIACALPVAISTDRASAREAGERFLARSARLPAYRRVLEREGVERVSDVVLVGDERELTRALDDLASLGVIDFHAVLFPDPNDPGARSRTFEFLAARARAVGDP